MGFEIYFIFIIGFMFLICLYIGLYIALSIVTPQVRNLQETEIEESERDNLLMPYYKEHLIETYLIKSKFGYDLQVYEMNQNTDSNKFVVISHGYTYSHHGSIKYAKMMIELGFNIVMYDHRFHGGSGGKNSTLGYYEQHDLKRVIDKVYSKYGDVYLGLYGESMGSATVLLEQENDSRIKFVISDAGFKDLKTQVKRQIKLKKLPPIIFYPIANIFVWFISRANLNKVSPIKSIENSHIPMMFIHSEQDEFIPYKDSVDMYETYSGPKLLYLPEKEAYHARSYYFNKEEYFNQLKLFNDNYLQK